MKPVMQLKIAFIVILYYILFFSMLQAMLYTFSSLFHLLSVIILTISMVKSFLLTKIF